MAQIPVVPISPPSDAAYTQASQGGDSYSNDGQTVVFVSNISASPIVVTRLVQTQPPAPDVCLDDTISCAEGTTILPALAPRRYSDPSGLVQLRYQTSQAANLTLAVVRIVPVR